MTAVFQEFSSGPEDYRFARTELPIRLAAFGDESLISRSSARRVLARLDRFSDVVLDYAGVRRIGQAFADEIYRVFASQHPNVAVTNVNVVDEVLFMIKRAKSNTK